MDKVKNSIANLANGKKYANSKIGYSNTYRTVKIVKDNGFGAEIDFSYRVKRFKCKNGCEHHNHLVCLMCGCYIHLDNERLEELQDQLAKNNGFKPEKHNFQIYGICKDCR